MTTNQILTGARLIPALAAGSGVPASRLRIPAIIVSPQWLLGPVFEPLVCLPAAVIPYDASLSLGKRKLTGHTRQVVIRLIVLGVLITTGLLWVLPRKLRLGELLGTTAQLAGEILFASGLTRPAVTGRDQDGAQPADPGQSGLPAVAAR